MPEVTDRPAESWAAEIAVIIPIHCKRCCAPFSIRMSDWTYQHPLTECSLSHKVYRTEIGSKGEVFVIEVPPLGDNFLG